MSIVTTVHEALARVLERVAGIGVVYPYPVPEASRRVPGAIVVPTREDRRPVTRDGYVRYDVEFDVWLGYPLDQRRPDVAWRAIEETVENVLRALRAPDFADELEDAGVRFGRASSGLVRLVLRQPEAGGPFVEARITVTCSRYEKEDDG
ncbi:MAG: hypothetical protein NZ761_03480 [Dehalococcoidia bacterium]|nr:hypothetical protein [Dehalococcoidia bacterium]